MLPNIADSFNQTVKSTLSVSGEFPSSTNSQSGRDGSDGWGSGSDGNDGSIKKEKMWYLAIDPAYENEKKGKFRADVIGFKPDRYL